MKTDTKDCAERRGESGAPKKSLLKMFFLTAIVVCGLGVSVGKAEAGTYTIDINKLGSGNGLVRETSPVLNRISCGSSCSFSLYPALTNVQLQALPDPSSVFIDWSGTCSTTGIGTCSTIMSQYRNIQPVFNLKSFAVTATSPLNGTYTVTGGTSGGAPAGSATCPGNCSPMRDYGSVLTVTASANPGYTFQGWNLMAGGACAGQGSPCTVPALSGNVNLGNPVFALTPIFRNLTVLTTGGGSVGLSPIAPSCGANCYMYLNTATATITATAIAPVVFSSWTNCPSPVGNQCVVPMAVNRTVTANFTTILPPAQYTLSATRSFGGTVSSSGGFGSELNCSGNVPNLDPCSVLKDENRTYTVTAAPDSWHYFDSWVGGYCNTSTNPVCTVPMGTSNKSVGSALFLLTFVPPPTYQLTVSKGGLGGGTVSGTGINCAVPCSASYTSGFIALTVTPDGLSTFAGWSGEGCAGIGLCIVNMSQARNVTATFNVTPVTYTLTATAPAAGTGTITSTSLPAGTELNCSSSSMPCSVSKNAGTVVTVKANASSGYVFKNWDPTGVCASETTDTCTVTMAGGNKVVGTAVFSLVPVGPSCDFVTGISEPVLNGGVANSGVMDFNDTTLSDQYRACTRWMGATDSNTSRAEGWVWNTNLGWVSFYCSGGLNAGIPCGSVDYGVTIDVDDGEFHGFAWGDGIGWISFNCLDDGAGCSAVNTHKVRAETDPDPECLGEVYSDTKYQIFGFDPPVGICPDTHTKIDTHAWSDNVGWIDFAGTRWKIPSFINVDVSLQISPDPTDLTKDDARVANGSDTYQIIVTLKDHDTSDPIVAGADYDIYMAPVWAVDTVKTDQTAVNINADYSIAGGGAVTKPLKSNNVAGDWLGDFTNVGDGTYVATVSSVAPTSNMNQYVNEADGTSVSNEKFTLPKSVFSNIQPNDLVLGGVNIWIFDNNTGDCALPAGFGSGPCIGERTYNTATVAERDFKYAPVGDVKKLTDEGGNAYVEATSGIPENFKVETVQRTIGDVSGLSYKFTIGLEGTSCYDLVVFDSGDGDGEITADKDFPTFVTGTNGVFDLPGIFKKPETCPESSIVPNPYLYSKVSYTVDGQNVQYYSAKLPRVSGTAVVNPVAVVKGSVYSTGVSNPGKAQTIRSLGDVSTNLLRDTVFRNVSALVAGVTPSEGSAVLGPKNSAFEIADGGGGVAFLPDSFDKNMVYYFRGGDVTIDNAGDISWTGNRTIIVVGGNVFIDQNLYNGTATIPKPKLGIIALKDLSSPLLEQARQGNIYINPKVTNIQANIYSDGTVFSYDGNHAHINPTGEPFFANPADYQSKTKSQLFIEGSIASQNTIGGAALNKPIIGTGELTTGTSQLGVAPGGAARALLYDLNFLRSFGAGFKRDPVTGDAISGNPDTDVDDIAKGDGSPWTIYDVPAGDLVPSNVIDPSAKLAKGLNNGLISTSPLPWTDFGAVYISFDPPPATLPGFNVVTGAEVKVRPQ